MKTTFYTFILMFVATFCWAQRNVNYVSFFPPANIVHDKVTLTQGTDLESQIEEKDYSAQTGRLILGAADGAVTNISTITITASTTNETISIFEIENIVKVSAIGKMTYVNIGNADSCDNTSCNSVFISANKIYFPLNGNYNDNIDYQVRSNNIAKFYKKWDSPIAGSPVMNFLPPIASNEQIAWINLRPDGTTKCRKYLVKYTGTKPEENCNVPSQSTTDPI